MIRLAFLLALLVAFLPHQSALASSDIIPGDILPGGPASELITETGTTIQVSKKRKRRKSRRKKKKKTKKEETKKEEPKKEILPGLDLSADVPEEDAEVPGVLDLSTVEGDTEAAKKELLMSGAPEESSSEGGSGFDFGGGFDLSGGDADEGGFDFGDDAGFDFGGEGFQIDSEQRERFEEAVSMMADEDYEDAALEFSFFLNDPVYKEFHPESEYQLAKALYKMGFLESSLNRFKIILARGPSHRRFRKSVQWLFFISRKVADEIPVLAELAKFRNVSFSKGYKDEFHYLLAKYLFIQAQRLEVEKLQKEKLEKDKKSKANEIDFSALADSMESDGGFDFGGGGFDFGGDDSGGGFDFGGGEEAAPAADEGGFDFGGGDDDAGDGGFDFGGGGDAAPAKSKDTAPKDSQEALRQGLELLVELNPENELYAESKYLQGLLAYLTGDDTQAVSSFQEVIRVLNPTQDVKLNPVLREEAFLSLARIHYAHKQVSKSVYYYDKIDRDSENWLTSLFEASWANYLRGDFEKSLGNLLTLHSPFFEREYFPESKLVKAIIYFEACRYDETREIVDHFIARFSRVLKEIQKIAESKDTPEQLFDRIEELRTSKSQETEDITARVVNLALADRDIQTASSVVEEIRGQLKLWKEMPEKFRNGTFGSQLFDELKEFEAERIRVAGEVTRNKFEKELYALKGLLAQALRIKLEVARSERDLLSRKLKGEKTDEEVIAAKAHVVVDDEHLYWPYEGEYWRDELGTYELDFSMCRPSGE